MRKTDLDDDDTMDFVVPPGGRVRVPIALMDGVQRQFAFDTTGHRPGFARLSDEQQRQRQATRSRYLKDLTTAWRGSPRPTEDLKDRTVRSFSDARPQLDAASAQAAKDAAYRERNRYLENAWRDTAPHDDPAAAMREHLRTEPDADAQDRRDAAYSAYKNRISNAWRGVEQQRRETTHEDANK